MRMSFTVLLVCLLVIPVVPGIMLGQAARDLTIEEAIRLGFENSKSLHSSEMKVQNAAGKADEVNASRLPSLKLAGNYTRLSPIDPFVITLPIPGVTPNTFVLSPAIPNNYTARATLTAPIFTGFKLENAVSAANYAVEASEADYRKDKSEIRYGVQAAYWTVYKAQEVLKVVDDNVAMMESHLKDARNMMEQGLLANNDVLKIQVQLSNTRLLQIDARNAVQLSMINLNSLIGLPLKTEVRIASEIRHEPRSFPQLSGMIDRAVEARPDMKAMDLRVKSGEAAVSSARGGWWPQIALVGNYTTARPNPRIVPSQDIFKDTWDVGVNISLDVWNWGLTAHQTAQAQAQLEQAKDAKGLMLDGVTLEVTQNYLALQQAKDKIAVAKETVEQAEENARITNDKFKEGLAVTTDVLDADASLIQAKTNYTQSLVDYELAQARLSKSIGEDQQ
jgi:outer membrane protein TolC